MGLHPRFDLKRWTREFPLSGLERSDIGQTITGPREVALVEQVRDAVRAEGADLGPPVPVDLCVWNSGDSPRRDVTKIGGAPYWPADEPWPEGESPYTFVAQFSFADSRDIVPALPGDILVMLNGASDYSHWSFHWYPLDGVELLAPSKVPASPWSPLPCHATLHRTTEYPHAASELFEAYPYPLGIWAKWHPDATKIGGTWTSRGELPPLDDYAPAETPAWLEQAWRRIRKAEQDFLCQLHSLALNPAWPFLNVATLAAVAEEKRRPLHLFDVGGVALFFDESKLYEDAYSG